ncbi:MAG: peptidoglycan-binding protein [Alphaproteobacteria bacterium]
MGRRRATALAAAALLAAGTVPSRAATDAAPAALVQAYQSGLAILGYDPGALDGVWRPQVDAAVAAFAAERGLDPADGSGVASLLFAAVRQRLAVEIGMDPTGWWDFDWQASGLPPSGEVQWPCQAGGSWRVSDGIVWSGWDGSAPLVLALAGDRLQALSPEPGRSIPANVFAARDADTLLRTVDGTTEVWVRCDGPPPPPMPCTGGTGE